MLDKVEPKPDENRLTPEQYQGILDAKDAYYRLQLKIKDAKIVEIMRQGEVNLDGTVASYELQLERKDAECQARVERIFKVMEEEARLRDKEDIAYVSVGDSEWWQALKKQEGTQDRP